MSTTNTETLTLYKHPQLYNGSRYKKYQTGIDYNNWLNSSSSGKLVKTVYYKSLNEPILLLEDIPILDEYTYGSITAMGKTYYIFIDSASTDQNGRTTINYTIDWWATEWAKATPTKGHITRISTKPNYMEQPFVPYKPNVTSESYIDEFSIFATYIPSNLENDSFISYFIMDGNMKNIGLVEQGYWYQEYAIPGADVKDCFIVPYFKGSDIKDSTSKVWLVYGDPRSSGDDSIGMWINRHFSGAPIDGLAPYPGDYLFNMYDNAFYLVEWNTTHTGYVFTKQTSRNIDNATVYEMYTESNTYQITNSIYMTFLKSNAQRNWSKTKTGVTISSNEVRKMGIYDWNGNTVWECRNDDSVSNFKINLLLGISHVMLEFLPNGANDNSSLLINTGFCYDCRHPGLFVDSYQDYILKNREYDIEMRKIQSEKQIMQAGFSTAENIGFGMAFGGGTGAVASGIGGALEMLGTGIINEIYDPKIQKQYDRKYHRMTDQISLVGDSITNVINSMVNNTGILRVYTITMDLPSQAIMVADIAANGYFANETSNTIYARFGTGVIIQADNVVVEGTVPLACKHQIVERLNNGVEFI